MIGSPSVKVKVKVTWMYVAPSKPAHVAQWRNDCAAVRMACVAVSSSSNNSEFI